MNSTVGGFVMLLWQWNWSIQGSQGKRVGRKELHDRERTKELRIFIVGKPGISLYMWPSYHTTQATFEVCPPLRNISISNPQSFFKSLVGKGPCYWLMMWKGRGRMDWANLGRPRLLLPTFTNRRFKEGVPIPYWVPNKPLKGWFWVIWRTLMYVEV